ncbi:MAG: hypothetical protein PHV77_04675 [Candidatus Omnitrophica bacterium]|jgi:hypothetical protein|nr:hypothetical protein [Candidatus Omnitrophota bacterium]
MEEWAIETTDVYERKYEQYEKKHPHELAAVIGNLDTYFKTLNEVNNPLQARGGFVHGEPDGIKAIDQKGGGQKIKLQQTRLYVYPDITNKILYLITIGDKGTQRDDINLCREFVKKEIRKRVE